MKKTSLIAKLALGLLVAIFVLASCADEVNVKKNTSYAIGGTTDGTGSKGLFADYGKLNENDYVWFYKTSVSNFEGTPAVKEHQTKWTTYSNYSNRDLIVGLKGGQTFSLGDWTLELWAYTSNTAIVDDSRLSTATGLAYYGKAYFSVLVDDVKGNVITTTDFVNADGSDGYKVYVPMQYVDTHDFDTTDTNFHGNNGVINYAFNNVITFGVEHGAKYDTPEGDYIANQDSLYDWFKYTTITSLERGDEWGKKDNLSHETIDIDNTSYTNFSAKPGTYSIETLYDGLGVYYKVVDTVDIHSNKAVKVTGNFENRVNKTFRVYFHDGKIFNADGTVNTPSQTTFTGLIDAINAKYNAEEGTDFFDGSEDYNGSGIMVPYKDYTFEDDLILPAQKSTTNSDFKKGYGFWGWYLTDSNWDVLDTEVSRTNWNTATFTSFVRTSGTTQTIFVTQSNENLTSTADHDFETAYGLTMLQNSAYDQNTSYSGLWLSADYKYEIHLYARWVELTKQVGAHTTNSDNITLYDAKFNAIGQDGYVHLTIVEGLDTVQGWTSFSDLKFYEKVSDGKIYSTTTSFDAGTAYKEYSIDGWYGDGENDTDVMVITNEGILARKSAGVSRFIDDNGNWVSQNGQEVKFYAHWQSRDKIKE
jgi:hypothetical protein